MKSRMSEVLLALLQSTAGTLQFSDVVIELVNVLFRLFCARTLSIRSRPFRMFGFRGVAAYVFEIPLISEVKNENRRDCHQHEIYANHLSAAGDKPGHHRSCKVGHR